MSKPWTTKTLIVWAVICTLFAASACSGRTGQDKPVPEQERVYLAGITDCRQPGAASAQASASVPGPDDDCVLYAYDADQQLLRLKHANTAFNCCAMIAADGVVEGSEISVREIDELRSADALSRSGAPPTATPCPCMCLYEMDFEIVDLLPGEYTVGIEQMYLHDEDETHVFTVDLATMGSGQHCVRRENYPWVVY